MIDTTLTRAAMELEELRLAEEQSSHNNKDGTTREALLRNNTLMNIRFPSNCLQLLFNIPGNTKCVDCGASNPQWATLSYGSLLCIECSGRHRQMGVHVSVTFSCCSAIVYAKGPLKGMTSLSHIIRTNSDYSLSIISTI